MYATEEGFACTSNAHKTSDDNDTEINKVALQTTGFLFRFCNAGCDVIPRDPARFGETLITRQNGGHWRA